MTGLDWLALAVVGLAMLAGFRKGLVASALSAVGIVAGAVLGARLAPHVLGGDDSPYTPLAGLLGAAAGAVLLETVGTLLGIRVRGALRFGVLRAVDTVGGLALGAATGLALVWVLGAAALYVPGQSDLRQAAQRSFVLRRLNAIAPPERLMEAIQRVDPFPSIVGPLPPERPADPSLVRKPAVRAASRSVVRVVGTACGLAVTGSGWVARRGVVVTAAHVVAGQRDTGVQPPGWSGAMDATALRFDARDDVAVLRVPGLDARPLRLGDGRSGEAVAILGYPEGGPLTAVAGRIGRTVTLLAPDAYGHGPVRRTVTTLSGDVRHGNSGGPALNARGEVETSVFAARVGSRGGYGVPPDVLRRDLRAAHSPVSTGSCARY